MGEASDGCKVQVELLSQVFADATDDRETAGTADRVTAALRLVTGHRVHSPANCGKT